MKALVTDKGLIIPKKLLKGIDEVYIQRKDKKILVIPVNSKDTIYNLGKNPVFLDITDASVNHDDYIYGNAK